MFSGRVNLMNYVFGVKALDDILSGALMPNSLVVVAGHPGAGKTTLASSICYANALKDLRCLYISFQESKEKLFRVMKNFNMDFKSLENKSFFKFFKLPLTKDVEKTVEAINELVIEWNPAVIVIDSINALMQAVEDPDKRVWLQNYFYSLSEIINGVVILIAEIPFGESKVELGSIEFVADVVIILRHKIERGLITRYLEIRKARGAQLTISEFSFSIIPGKGIDVFIPPLLSETEATPPPKLKPPCSFLDNILGSIDKGFSIYVEHPPDFRVPEAVPLILGIAIRNKMKGLYLSYRYSTNPLIELIAHSYIKYCKDKDKLMENLRKYVVTASINPFRYSVAEGLSKECEVMRGSEADLVIFHAVEIPAMTEKHLPEYIPSLYNQINILKQQHKVIARIYSSIDDSLRPIYEVMADLIIRFIPINEYNDYKVYVWKRGEKPITISSKDIDKCIEEIASSLC
ncbi:MAG: ATPase domain-containing protein [Ignisphaera sp.]